MNAKLNSKSEVGRYEFSLEVDRKSYWVVVYTNVKGKFIDNEIYHNGELVDNNDLESGILDYLDKNWDSLTNS